MNTSMKSLVACLAVIVAVTSNFTRAAEKEEPPAREGQGLLQVPDITYAVVDGFELKLDLSLPGGAKNPPLVVYIHGGSWRAGSRKGCPINWLVDEGYAVASISYRLSDRATFPAQIVDCKGALRFLRANAAKYGYSVAKVGVAGSSAGGHLAVLLGTSGGLKELEGDVGGNLDQSSRVDAIVDYYGPTDFPLRSKTHPARSEDPKSGTAEMLGGPVSKNLEIAKLASGVTHVSGDDPPLLILHGDKDKTVLMDQSESLRDAYRRAGLEEKLIVVPGGGHGGAPFNNDDNRRAVLEFLDKHLRENGK